MKIQILIYPALDTVSFSLFPSYVRPKYINKTTVNQTRKNIHTFDALSYQKFKLFWKSVLHLIKLCIVEYEDMVVNFSLIKLYQDYRSTNWMSYQSFESLEHST